VPPLLIEEVEESERDSSFDLELGPGPECEDQISLFGILILFFSFSSSSRMYSFIKGELNH
jgi:hypothetical protein